MKLVDSSVWIHILAGTESSPKAAKHLTDYDKTLVSTLVVFEVYRQLLKKVSEEEALLAISQMERGLVVSPSRESSLLAAQLSLRYRLGAMDSLIYAQALEHSAELVTFDNDFRKLPGCLVL